MTVINGNCNNELSKLQDESIDLVYLDPPFFSQKVHQLKSRDNSKHYQFSDQWDSLDEYLDFIGTCLLQCKQVLKKSGSLFLHCNRSAAHHLRLLLDDIFGAKYFQSEIIWSYKRWSNTKKGLLNSHQTIYFYSKTKQFKFNTLYTDYSPTTNIDQILQKRKRDKNGKAVYMKDETGTVVLADEKKGVPLSDVWAIPYLNPKAKERVGYPTQKPILLLERIIKLVTDQGDIVLDPMCGSGTTLVAAKRLNRQFIGIDSFDEAVKLAKKRLIDLTKSESHLLKKGQKAYLNKNQFQLSVLKSIDAIPVQRNKGIDGFLKQHYLNKPVPIKIQKPTEPFEVAKQHLIAAAKKRHCELMILIRTTSLNQGHLLTTEDITDEAIEESLLVLDAYNLLISDWLKSK